MSWCGNPGECSDVRIYRKILGLICCLTFARSLEIGNWNTLEGNSLLFFFTLSFFILFLRKSFKWEMFIKYKIYVLNYIKLIVLSKLFIFMFELRSFRTSYQRTFFFANLLYNAIRRNKILNIVSLLIFKLS